MQFETVCKENYAKIYNYVLAKTGKKEAAEDITQEVFYIAYQKGEYFLKHEKPLAFLYTAAKNLTCDYFRKTKKVIPYETIRQTAGCGDVFDQICSQNSQNIDETVYYEQILQNLTASERRLYRKYYMEKETLKQIARELGIQETALRMKYVRLRKKVRKLVAKLQLDDF